jgi:alkylhydroperoxidase family enzyme
MPRIPYVDPKTAPASVREVFDGLPVPLNIFKMMAHAETNFRPLLRLGASILTEQELSAKNRELIILQVVKLAGGEYEWVQHVPIALAVGATDAQVEALEAQDLEAACFDDAERALLGFATEVSGNVRVGDATFAATQAHFSPREIVESILTVGFYMMAARLTEATETDLDEPAGTKIVDSAARDDL